MGYSILGGSVLQGENAVTPRIAVSSLRVNERFTVEGKRFNQLFHFNFTNGETRYFLYQLPSDAGVTVALQKRHFKTFHGDAELKIWWDSTGFTPGPLEFIFNEYNKTRNDAKFQVSEISQPTDLGLLREVDFIVGSGVGNNSSGDVAPDLGFRLYAPDTFFIAEVINLHSSNNTIHLGYDWGEVPPEELKL